MRRISEAPIKDVRLIADKYTNKSRGFCFIEFSSIEDGTRFYKKLTAMDPPLEIHGRRVAVSYQREPQPNKPSSQAAAGAIAAAQWSATTQNKPDNKEMLDNTTSQQQNLPNTVGSYVYDEKSGFYYDNTSGLYYDPKTKYYYNPTDQNYYFWNEETQQYDTVPQQGSNTNTAGSNNNNNNTPNITTQNRPTTEATIKPSKSTKAITAKKIQKDMERWAKAKNRQVAAKAPPKPDPPVEPEPQKIEPTGHSIALKIAQDYADPAFQQVANQPPQTIFPVPQPAAPPKPLTDEELSKKFEDLNAMACLLCKRKFPSVENLKRHQELSDLHKSSLAAERQRMDPSADLTDYRDRALERRNKFAIDTHTQRNKFMR